MHREHAVWLEAFQLFLEMPWTFPKARATGKRAMKTCFPNAAQKDDKKKN
jgi:hypothetical protein